MSPWSSPYAGRLEELTYSSELLRDNPLGDPHERRLGVYVPPGYDDDPGRRYPSVYVLQGYGGQVAMWLSTVPFRSPFTVSVDRLFAAGGTPPAIVVYVDSWTAYGGSQFVDSVGTGPHHSHLCEELVPYVDAHYRTLDAPEHRAICGKSSGGFGAMITPMLRPDLFGALATHAGDNLYELAYVPEFAKAVRDLRPYDGDVFAWWAEFRDTVVPDERAGSREFDMRLAMLLGLSACYSPDPDGTPVLPFDPLTGALRPEPWQRWLDWDPVRMVPAYAERLRGLRGIWIDAGTRDEWFLDVGAQAFRAALIEGGVAEDRIAYELYDASHSIPPGQYLRALDWLAHRIAPEAAA